MSETVLRLAARGDGVTDAGHFLKGTAPGDIIEADGSVIPGVHRAIPPCGHYGVCGGCQLQHIDDTSYAGFVTDRITRALAEHRVDAPAFAQVHLSAPKTRRRATLRAERRGGQVLLGFNESASHAIVDVRECHVLLPGLVALLAPLRRLLAVVMPERRRATVTLTRVDQGIDVLLAGFELDGMPAIEALNVFAQTHRLARLSLDEGFGPSPRWSPQTPTITLGGVPVAFPDGAFLQATADGEAALIQAVRETVGHASTTLDLFAGLGTFALSLNGRVKAVEGSRDAALALSATRCVSVEHRDLFRRPLTVAELNQVEAIVLDPPRAGAREQVAELSTSSVPRIAYVSCNPATFARDARILIDGGYRLERVVPVGQFRWSTHVEIAASFRR